MKNSLFLYLAALVLIFPTMIFPAPLFGDKVEYPAGIAPIDICAADFNGDGTDDLAIANFTYSDIDVSILINRGDGTFDNVVSYNIGRNYIQSLARADLDNDGDIDLAVARAGSTNNVLILLNNGDGTFILSKTYTAGEYALSLCSYDLNNDSLIDLAVAYEASNEMSILLNNGDSTFTDTAHYACGTWATSITGGDFNNDSAVDLAVTNAIDAYTSGRLSIYINKGDGTFMDSVNYPAGWQPYSVFAGDFDDDNNLDLAVADGDYGGRIVVLMGSDSAVFQTPAYYDVGHNARDVYAANLDNNNSLDIIAGIGTDSSVVVLLNNGDGTFLVENSYPVGNYIYNVCGGDFDRDGDIDLAAAGQSHGQVIILFNQTITYTAVSESRNGNSPNSGFSLSSNHPNPFNPITTFEYTLPYRSDVSINVYNLLGQKVRTLFEGEKSRGTYSVRWNGADYFDREVAAGIYFYRMKAGDFVETKKMVLLK